MTITWTTGLRWLRLSSIVGASQLVVQGINAVTGVILVRTLSKMDYALLTIAGSLLATLSLLADGGIASAITAMCGRVNPNRTAMSSVIRACLGVRNRLASLSLMLTLPPFYFLLTSTGLSTGWTLVLLILGASTLWPSTDAKFLSVPLRILGQVQVTQQIDMAGGAVRLLLTTVVILTGLGFLIPAFVAIVFSAWVQSWMVRRRINRWIDPSVLAAKEDVHEVGGFVRSLYANHVFFCIQGQLATWIISWTSGANEIADAGALGRLTVIFSILAALYHYLVMPNLAATRSARLLRFKFVLTFTLTLGAISLLVILVSLLPQPFLWILGEGYSHLEYELTLAFAAQGLAFANSILWIFLQIRGCIRHAWLNIPLTLLGYTLAASLFSLNTVAGVLLMTGTACLPPLLWVAWQCWRSLSAEIHKQQAAVVSET